jgi:hypothetical protein
MRLAGPYHFKVFVAGGDYRVRNSSGGDTFQSPVTCHGPKVYVFAAEGRPFYIGQTVQGMAARIRVGFKADGTGGYHGYAWRRELSSADLLIWCLQDVTEDSEINDLESVEAEIVFQYRNHFGQWPQYQTEIHFHPTSQEHRRLASEIFTFFVRTSTLTVSSAPQLTVERRDHLLRR